MSIRNTLPFSIVPEWLLTAEVSANAVRLYGLLVRYADKEGHAHPSRRTLGKRIHVSPDTIDRALKELVAIGAVEVEHRRDESGDLTSNAYILRPGGRKDAATRGRTDAATVAAPMRHEREPLEREPLERDIEATAETNGAPIKKHRAKHKPDPIWDVFVEIYGEPTPLNRKAWNAAAKVLRDFGADPEELRTFINGVAGTPNHWAGVTPTAAAKHYGQRARLVAGGPNLQAEVTRRMAVVPK